MKATAKERRGVGVEGKLKYYGNKFVRLSKAQRLRQDGTLAAQEHYTEYQPPSSLEEE